jgi:hypothetical protein
MLQSIAALKDIGQWVESVWECRITGGFIEPGAVDLMTVEVVLRAYVEQI